MTFEPLAGGIKVQSQRVHRTLQLCGQQTVNTLVPRHLALPLKLPRHNHYLEVGFGVGRNVVLVALVDHLKVIRRKGFRQFSLDICLNIHGRKLYAIHYPPPNLDASLQNADAGFRYRSPAQALLPILDTP